MKITIEQHGIKTSVEYHDEHIDVHQLGALVHAALTGVGWSEITLENIMNKEAFDWDFVVEKETEETTYSIGDRFLCEENHDEYILAHIYPCAVALINLSTGERGTHTLGVKNSKNISSEEFEELAGGELLTPIEKP